MPITKELMLAGIRASRAMNPFCESIDLDEVTVDGGSDYLSLTLGFENIPAFAVVFLRESASEPIFLGKGFKLNNKTFEGIAESAKQFATLKSQLGHK